MNRVGLLKLVQWLSRVVLILGAIGVVASILFEHPLMYRGGAVQYPWQAIAIAQRTCGDIDPELRESSLPWVAQLNKDSFASEYRWSAGFGTRDGECGVIVSAQTGKIIELRMGAR